MSNLPIVTLTRAIHRKESQILIGFKYDWVLIDVVKHLPQAKWSNSLKSWHVDDTIENPSKIYKLFENKAEFDDSLLVEIVKLSEGANQNINHL